MFEQSVEWETKRSETIRSRLSRFEQVGEATQACQEFSFLTDRQSLTLVVARLLPRLGHLALHGCARRRFIHSQVHHRCLPFRTGCPLGFDPSLNDFFVEMYLGPRTVATFGGLLKTTYLGWFPLKP